MKKDSSPYLCEGDNFNNPNLRIMKKFYSLIAVAMMVTAVNAQGSESFETQTILKGSYASGTFAGETEGVTVNYVASRNEGEYPITGKGIMLRRADEPSSVEFVIPNGVGEFTFKYRKAFTVGEARVLAVVVDGVQQEPVIGPFGAGAGADATVYTSTIVINKTGAVSVKITYPTGTAKGGRQVTIDDVSWTAPANLSVVNFDKVKETLVKNTVVTNEVSFLKDAKVQIINLNGQVVKTAAVKENQSLSVNELPKGVYIVTGVVDGKVVSQKIIKK